MNFSMDYFSSPEWTEYLALTKNRPELFEQDSHLEIILDKKTILDYMNLENRKIGLLYRSSYSMMLVDLVRDTDGNVFAYERLAPVSTGKAVVVVPSCNGKYILLQQFRHAIRRLQYSFPRGFGEDGLSALENAVKEIKEEIGAEARNLSEIGHVEPDSGVLSSDVTIVCCEIDSYIQKTGYEGICSLTPVSKEEMEQLIGNGQITDSYTLAAWALISAKH